MSKKTYIVEVEKANDRWWTLFCPNPSIVSQCRSLSRVHAEITPIIAEIEGIDESDIELSINYKLPDDYLMHIATAEKAREISEREAAKTREETRKAARVLIDSGVTMRDAGTIMGLSYQRVSQLART